VAVGANAAIDTIVGYKIRWPIFAVARSTVQFTWVCTETERAALVTFFETQAGRAFKWTAPRPGAIPVAYRALVGPEESMVSPVTTPDTSRGTFHVSIRAVELLWTGTNV